MDRNQYLDITKFLKVIWKGKWVILSMTLIFFMLFGIRLYQQKPTFTTYSKLIMSSSGSTNSLPLGLATLAGINRQVSDAPNLSNYLEHIIKDDDFLTQVLDNKWFLDRDSVTLEQFWYKLKHNKLPPASTSTQSYQNKKNQLNKLRNEKYIQIKREKGSNLVILQTSFRDSLLSYQVNRFLINKIDSYFKKNDKSMAFKKRAFIEKQIGIISNELVKCENELKLFKEENVTISTPKLQLELSRKMRKVNLNQELYIELKKQFELAKIDELKENPAIQVLSRPTIPIEKDKTKKLLNLGVGTFMGLVLGLFLAFIPVIISNFIRPLYKEISS